MTYPETSEHDKLEAAKKAVGEFVAWLASKDYAICQIRHGELHDRYVLAARDVPALMAEFFGIDPMKDSP